MRAAPDTSTPGLSSTLTAATLPSSAISEKRLERTPMPCAERSVSSPAFLTKSPLPSARNSSLSSPPVKRAPCRHHVMVVGGEHGDRVHAARQQRVVVLEVARQVVVVAGGREGAGHAEHHYLLAGEDVGRGGPSRRPA